MSILPPVGPSSAADRDDSLIGQTPDMYYVSAKEATDDDKVTWMDKLAIVGAVAFAQLIRLGIIFAAIGIIILVIFIAQHIP